MTRLADEYFKRDLTEDEEARLARELESSPEEAGHLADLADREYALTQLPEPQWTRSSPIEPLNPCDVSSPLSKVLRLLPALLKPLAVAAAVGCAGAGYVLYTRNTPTPSGNGVAPLAFLPTQTATIEPVPTVSTAIQSVPATLPVASPSAETPIPTPSLPPTPEPESNPSPPPTAVPMKIGPEESPGAVGRTFDRLSVVLTLETRGIVTVRVIAASGEAIRTLFAGVLDPDTWRFTWDGRTDTGLSAIPGPYRVEVKAGGKTVEKEVRLEKE